MATVTAAMVKELRDKTGAGMMDCKAALTETGGDMEAAVDRLRAKGLAKASKKAGRVAAEGLIAVESSGHTAAMLEVNSETDFVARNDSFQAFAREASKIALMGGDTVEDLQGMRFPGSQTTVGDRMQELIATIGENMTLRRLVKMSVPHGLIATYVHNAVTEGLGKIGVLVALETEGDATKLGALGRQIAMHVAAANPAAVDADGLDPHAVERERAILREKNATKPANMIERIVESGLKTHYKDVTLLGQAFVHEPSKSVAQVLKEQEGRIGAPIRLAGFKRFALGEGIEREESDFAAEVAAQSGVRKPDGDDATV